MTSKTGSKLQCHGRPCAEYRCSRSGIQGGTIVDVVLAEYLGRTWLVQGEQHIDDLLANTLRRHITIEVVSCESKSAVVDLWRVDAGPDANANEIWLIHPAIADRARGSLQDGNQDLTVGFAEWSAALDGAAADVIAAAAARAAERPEMMLAVIRHVAADGLAILAELGNLRSSLIEARLATLGLEAGRMVRDAVPAEAEAQADRISLVLRLPD